MSVINRIIPGKVVNDGIRDVSIQQYATVSPTSPLHLPVIHVITPRGPLASEKGTNWINIGDFNAIYGSISDHRTAYYGPTTLLLQALAKGGQSTVGIRRLSANTQKARVAISAFVQQTKITQYERDINGNFKRDKNGDKIPTGDVFDGLRIIVQPDPEAANVAPGELLQRTITGTPANGTDPAVPDTYVYPLFEAIAGVGDYYNQSGLRMGVQNTQASYRNITEFMKTTGVYPFDLQTFMDTSGGSRVFAKSVKGRLTIPFTLFKTEYLSTEYSLEYGFGEFTNTNVNRKVIPIPAPFEGVHVYQDSITALCMAMYAVEQPKNTSLMSVSPYVYQQMNPFTCVNHTGSPYYAIETGPATTWDLNGAVNAQYGISPFLDDTGAFPAGVTQDAIYDPLGLLTNVKMPISIKQGWETTNILMEADLIGYLAGTENKNYTKNRQSLFWDVGYEQPVKDTATQLLAARKDILVIPCASVWDPSGAQNDLNEVYSRFATLTAAVRMYPESEVWGTATCRSAINLVQAKVIDEATGGYFSANIDLAYQFAQFAGNQAGTIRPAFSPDSGDQRILTIMHSPTIEFEDEYIGADNFDNGGITMRPYDTEQFFRPALATVYTNPDSVLKDLVTCFNCVSIEKILQDVWNTVCGDTTLTAANYIATVKDRGERKCRDALGGQVSRIIVTPSYNESVKGGRAVMNVVVSASFNKGKYMMTLDLYAYNEEDTATTTTGTGVTTTSVTGGTVANP